MRIEITALVMVTLAGSVSPNSIELDSAEKRYRAHFNVEKDFTYDSRSLTGPDNGTMAPGAASISLRNKAGALIVGCNNSSDHQPSAFSSTIDLDASRPATIKPGQEFVTEWNDLDKLFQGIDLCTRGQDSSTFVAYKIKFTLRQYQNSIVAESAWIPLSDTLRERHFPLNLCPNSTAGLGTIPRLCDQTKLPDFRAP